jgi:hypothetical protein
MTEAIIYSETGEKMGRVSERERERERENRIRKREGN